MTASKISKVSGPTAGVKEQSQLLAENRKDHRHGCQEEIMTHMDPKYLIGKVLTYLTVKVIECKEFNKRTLHPFEQVTTDV